MIDAIEPPTALLPTVLTSFIGEQIAVERDDDRPLKRPDTPTAFRWRGRRYVVLELLRQWTAAPPGRGGGGRPRFAVRSGRGYSWGGGRTYFRLRTDGGTFEIYYDRRPAGDRLGSWHLWRRLD
jgi:hypothetical protein